MMLVEGEGDHVLLDAVGGKEMGNIVSMFTCLSVGLVGMLDAAANSTGTF